MLLNVILSVASGSGDGENILIPASYLLSRYSFDTRIVLGCKKYPADSLQKETGYFRGLSENVKSCDERCKARWNLVYCDLRTEMDGGFMKISRKKSYMLLVVVVAGIFAAASACLAVLGVFIYKTAASDQSQQDLSHASEYLQKQARSCSDAGDLRIATLSGQISALVLSERKNGEDRELWIFVEDGYLRSASVKSGETVSAKDGKKITPLRSMDPRITGSDLLEISMRSESTSAVCRVWIPGIGGGNE